MPIPLSKSTAPSARPKSPGRSTYRPFCSKRCQLLDLGAWADESHRIGGESAMDEADIETLLAQADKDAPLS